MHRQSEASGASDESRTVLLVAYHFTPQSGSSGVQRATRFARYLPSFGWRPVVLTTSASAYEQRDEIDPTPPDLTVIRVPCLDAGRHLAIAGRYPSRLAIPDRWASWRWAGVRMGVRACAAHRVGVIWSTYPIATAHDLAARIATKTGLPWVADFRDPMCGNGWPTNPSKRAAFEAIESTALERAARVTCVTEEMVGAYADRYARFDDGRLRVVENGFDEEEFEELGAVSPPPVGGRPLVLLHSGLIYPIARDPGPFMHALARVVTRRGLGARDLTLRFRAPVHEALLRDAAAAANVQSHVEIAPPVAYRDALREMMEADGLVAMQGAHFRDQVPAKLYEYLRAGRPVLGLADPEGATGRLLTRLDTPYVAALESVDAIERALDRLVGDLVRGAPRIVPRAVVDRFSRWEAARRLARVLDEAVAVRSVRVR